MGWGRDVEGRDISICKSPLGEGLKEEGAKNELCGLTEGEKSGAQKLEAECLSEALIAPV